MDDYERIAQVIRYLDAHRLEQPGLDELARVANLSPHHFHRLFVRWAGITPKSFLDVLTLRHAKAALRRGESVLGASLDSGLSGPGRLHDLCVSLEAVSPGEWKSGGAGLEIVAGFASSPFGLCHVAESSRGVCNLSFLEDTPEARAEARVELENEWPGARISGDDAGAEKLARRIFHPGASNLPIRALVKGTAFQVRVWRALLEVPPGALITYGRLAAGLGLERSSRAVGSAVGRNALAYLIPCHRVILGTGVIGQYRWGSARKKALLAWEAARLET